MVIITCNCRHCDGRQARIRGDVVPLGDALVHNLVAVAHSPLARADSAKRFGPWPVARQRVLEANGFATADEAVAAGRCLAHPGFFPDNCPGCGTSG